MNHCKKCRSKSISGPFYRTKYGVEFLLYKCLTCGYESMGETADANTKKLPQFDQKLLSMLGKYLEEA